ncbi:MAG: hypothetical protein L0Z50_20665 [Verrucomicrobiales bacterium]|nr:hypothetical protein [Verrucomicrobiales bacterium]
MKDQLLTPELRNGAGLSIRELRKNDLREGLTGFQFDPGRGRAWQKSTDD